MKTLAILGGVVSVTIGVLYFIPSTQEFVTERIVEVEKIEVVDALAVRIKEAQTAAATSTISKAQEAYNKVYEVEMKRIADTVKGDYIAEIEETISDASYWREGHRVKRLIQQVFPEDPHVAVAVATCESGLKTNAYNPNNTNGSTDGGLWQINSVHDKELKRLGLDKFNPVDATKFARILYEQNGWSDWVCYTHSKIALR